MILGGYMPEKLALPLVEAPVLGPWAHLGFERKREKATPTLYESPAKHECSSRNGLDVKLPSISPKIY